nr:MAG TPA: hypothetical protein [Caudoviricetes sp.]
MKHRSISENLRFCVNYYILFFGFFLFSYYSL